MSNPKGQPTSKEILDAVRTSGYLMEQEVATLIEELGFHVETNRAFLDEDEAKSRELDVWAYRSFHKSEEFKFNVAVELICECKNNSNPFVFITRLKNEKDKNKPDPSEYLFPLKEYYQVIKYFENGRAKSWNNVPPFQRLNLAKDHYYYKQNSKAVQFFTLVRKGSKWEANHGGIYDAIFYPLVKALLSRRQEVSRHKPLIDEKDLNFDQWKTVNLFFPIVVLQGDIYCIDSMATEPEPVKVPNITFSRELKSKNINGRFTIDFVNIKDLKNFIKSQITPFVQQVVSLVENSPELFMLRKIE